MASNHFPHLFLCFTKNHVCLVIVEVVKDHCLATLHKQQTGHFSKQVTTSELRFGLSSVKALVTYGDVYFWS